MSQTTVLVIDDSATIRRLADGALSRAGYRVVVAENAEVGLRLAAENRPGLILLDHQLPGTTGADVCRKLNDDSELRLIPVVISSTLRKKAYVEYMELPNVVDMLPKPYTEELLATTVANALDTGALVVESQTQGTAVPEVLGELEEADLTGTFVTIGLREVLDFLNNGAHHGTLEVDAGQCRTFFSLEKGRIQAVVATGVDPEEIASALPDSLVELSPVLNLTVAGRASSEADGLMQLLNTKVLDPRLLRTLLRFQAAQLVQRCFFGKLKSFRFEAGRIAPPLFRKLPLDISLIALLVEAAFHRDEADLPQETEETVYVRRAVRGQNLDRAGLSARHMKVVGLLSEPISPADISTRLGWDRDEVRRVLHGLVMAELVEMRSQSRARQIIVWETDPASAGPYLELFKADSDRFAGKVVRDRLAVQLLLKRSRVDAVILPWDTEENIRIARDLVESVAAGQSSIKWIGVLPRANGEEGNGEPGASATGDRGADCCEGEAARLSDIHLQPPLSALLQRPFNRDDLECELNRVFAEPSHAETVMTNVE